MKVECVSFEIELFTDVETILVIEIAVFFGHRDEGCEIGIDVLANDSLVISFVPFVENDLTLRMIDWIFRNHTSHSVLMNCLGFSRRNVSVVNPGYEFEYFSSNGDRLSPFLLRGGWLFRCVSWDCFSWYTDNCGWCLWWCVEVWQDRFG